MANIIEITDFEAPELDVFTRLTENQLLNRHEPEKGIFIESGEKPGRSWSGSRSFRFSQRSLRFSPK